MTSLPSDEPPAEPPPAGQRDRYVGDAAGAAAVEIQPAATVMLVRDGTPDPADGSTLEVCLLRRNLQSEFVGGVHVFPGGGVDAADAEDAMLARCDGRSAEEAEAAGGLAFWVASIRESFEEAGLLAAHWEHDGAALHFGDGAVAERFADHRRAVDAGERALADVLIHEGLRLDLTGTHFVSRWITPLGLIRRYDTRFFVAAAPVGQQVIHDGREAIAAEWHRPARALERHARGEMVMRIPTVVSLRWLAASPSASAALAAAAAIIEPPVVEGPPRTPRAPGSTERAPAELAPTVPATEPDRPAEPTETP